MATTAERIFIPGRARVYLAPVGSPQPSDLNAALPPIFIEVGHFADDSLTFTTDPNFEEVRSHQSDYAVRRYQTEDNATMEVDLQEFSANSFKAVFGGGDVTQLTSGAWKYTPPALGGREEVMCVIKAIDGKVPGTSEDRVYMFVIPRAMQIEGVDTALNKAENAVLPLRLSVLGSDVGDPWYLLTSDDPAWSTSGPVFTSITPTTDLLVAGGTPVTISGTGLANLTGVWFGATGTATAGTATTLTDGAATWTVDAFAGGTVAITAGTGSGQTQAVVSNTDKELTVASWATTPDNTSEYMVYKPATSYYVNSSGTQATAISPAMPTGTTAQVFLPNTVGVPVDGGAGNTVTYA